MPVRAPGLTSSNPPHNADWMPSCGATAARRTEPGVCAVPGSNPAGLTMRIGGYSVTMSMNGSWSVMTGGLGSKRDRVHPAMGVGVHILLLSYGCLEA